MTAASRSSRRFPAPWQAIRTPGGYKVVDAAGQSVCYIYGEDRPKGVADQSLSVDEAWRIATGIARLPELLGRKMPDAVASVNVVEIAVGARVTTVRRLWV